MSKNRLLVSSVITAYAALSLISNVGAQETGPIEIPNKDFAFNFNKSGGQAYFYTYRAGMLPDIYVRSKNGQERNLTNRTTTWDIEPALSPDGQQIIYSSGVDMASLSLRIMDADGSNDRVFYDGSDNEVGTQWSPDGTKVLFSVFNNNERTNIIYLTDPKGHKVKALTDDLPGQSSNASWSPDSMSIIFANRPNEQTQRDIYIMDADGKNRRQITRSEMSETAPIFSPPFASMSPHIIFVGQVGDGDMQLYTAPIKDLECGKAPTQLSNYDGQQLYFLTIKPGGQEIAFSKGDWTNGFSLTTMPVPELEAAPQSE